MKQILKNIGFGLVVMALTAFFYWLIFMDRAEKQDALAFTMNLLSKQLLAMIPDTAEKDSVATMYREFVRATEDRTIPPESVERVAANIINLSNADTVITPAQAKAVLEISMATPLPVPQPEPAAPADTNSMRTNDRHFDVVNQRIQSLMRFNDTYRKSMRRHSRDPHKRQRRPPFRVDQHMRVIMDPAVREQLKHWKNDEKLRTLEQELKALERQRRLEWRKDVLQHYREEMKQAQQELAQLEQQMATIQQDSALTRQLEITMETVKHLSTLPVPPVVPPPDSLLLILQKKLNH